MTRRLWIVGLSGATLGVALGTQPLFDAQAPVPGTPKVVRSDGYLGAAACGVCHPEERASFERTYHRTMTRTASEVWRGTDAPDLPVTLRTGDLGFELERDEDGTVWARGPDLHALGSHLARNGKERPLDRILEDVPESRRRLTLVTGSHHYLAFWLEGGPDKELRQLPFVFLLTEKRWAPREEIFLKPPEEPMHIARWNANCIQCHAVAGQPNQSEEMTEAGLRVKYETTVADFGITCEACHGPGEAHARQYRSPIQRFLARLTPRPGAGKKASGVVHPLELSAQQEVTLCGQCHAYFLPTDPDSWWDRGYVGSYRPGMDDDPSRQLLTPDPRQHRQARLSRGVESIFWGDGTIRVGGREATGVRTSPCYERGTGSHQIRCTSCHSLHDGSRSDQLRPELVRDVDTACIDCHANTKEHSGHRLGSAGASCVNCHMPKTTYALLKSIRSHRIRSPSHRMTDPPSPCVLCHIDRSEAWHHEQLQALFPHLTPPKIPSVAQDSEPPEAEVPFGVRRALQGDAAERAIFSAALASPEVQRTVGVAWPRALAQQLRADPYDAVRRIAERSLAELPRASSNHLVPPLPIGVTLTDLHQARDETPVVISE